MVAANEQQLLIQNSFDCMISRYICAGGNAFAVLLMNRRLFFTISVNVLTIEYNTSQHKLFLY